MILRNGQSSKGYIYMLYISLFPNLHFSEIDQGYPEKIVEYIISKYSETLQVLRTTDVSGELVSCPETSVRNYLNSLRNNTQEHSSHLLRCGRLKSRIPSISPNMARIFAL